MTTFSLVEFHGAIGKKEFKVHIGSVTSIPRLARSTLCGQSISGASMCKKFNASSTKKDSAGAKFDPIIADGGIFTFPLNEIPKIRQLLDVYMYSNKTQDFVGKTTWVL